MMNLFLEWLLLNVPEGLLYTWASMYNKGKPKINDMRKLMVGIFGVGIIVFVIPKALLLSGVNFATSTFIGLLLVTLFLILLDRSKWKRTIVRTMLTYVVSGFIEISFATYILKTNSLLMNSIQFKVMSFTCLKLLEFIVIYYIILNGGDIMKKLFIFGKPEKRTRK